MRCLSLLLALAFIGGLLISGQALAADQHQSKGRSAPVVMAGEQLRQWHQAQEQLQQEYLQAQVQAVQLNEVQVREMQRLLNEQGYRISSIDGDNIGQETTAAIHSFQKDGGLTVTGMPNVETLDALSPSSGYDEFFGLAPDFGEPLD